MSASVSSVKAAIGTALATISGLRVHDYQPDNVTAPMAWPILDAVNYHEAMSGGMVQQTYRVGVLVGRQTDRATQRLLDSYLSPNGIPAALETMRGKGNRLFVATSKPHVFARPILEHFGLADRFHAIHGSELDGRNDDKADLIAMICREHAIDPTKAVMIGDRKFDVAGAMANQLPCVGVLWGYGTREELVGAGAATVVETPRALASAVERVLAAGRA